jgi:hypothetical protein
MASTIVTKTFSTIPPEDEEENVKTVDNFWASIRS